MAASASAASASAAAAAPASVDLDVTCAFCDKLFNIVFVASCESCDKPVCFNCRAYESPQRDAFCRNCAYPCAAKDCNTFIWPGSEFKRKVDKGRVDCSRCKQITNLCAVHTSASASTRVIDQNAKPCQAPRCKNVLCPDCLIRAERRHRGHCDDHIAPCSACEVKYGHTLLSMCGSATCKARFCGFGPFYRPDEYDSRSCVALNTGYDNRALKNKCTRHLHDCSMCTLTSEPHAPSHRVLEDKKLCEVCTQRVGFRVNTFFALLKPELAAQGTNDLKRLVALHLVDVERRAVDAWRYKAVYSFVGPGTQDSSEDDDSPREKKRRRLFPL